MVSVIIPARNEVYLEKTIRNVLSQARGEIEVIVELDGYLPDPRIDIGDTRVTFIHHPTSIGQRQCINDGARRAKGKYVMKLDAHCALDEGWDIKLAADCEYDWTVIPRMYNLDVDTWKPKLNKRTDYMYISSPTAEKPFRSTYYNSGQPKSDKLIDDIMDCMGPCFFMHKDRFWELGGCDENHGGWGQQGIEVACKAWLSGGALKVNKKTWFAHWFRGGGGPGFPYEIKGSDQEKARQYSQDLWLNDKWDKAKRKFQWMVDKFNPPGWVKNKLSVIIPSYKDPCLHKTIDSILKNFKGDFEIIPVLDGWETEIVKDERVKPIYLKNNVGMRNAINIGVLASSGNYLMRTDEHCMFSEGFDTEMLSGIQPNYIVTPRRYFLDPEKWEKMDIPPIDYEKLIIRNSPDKFTAVRWKSRTKERKDKLFDENMAFQGSCWIMPRSWWDKVIVKLDSEGYGTHYQDTTEMLFKTWRDDGKLMLNKKAWYAHKHRSFNRTHQYPLQKAIPEWRYALDLWKDDYEKVRAKWGI